MPAGILAGKATLRVDGVLYSVDVGAKSKPGRTTREAVIDSSGKVAGFIETAESPALSFDLLVTDDVRLTDVGKWIGVTADLSMANGRSYVFTGATTTNNPEHDLGTGKATVEMTAESCTERKP